MPDKNKSKNEADAAAEPFITIDDIHDKAWEVVAMTERLREYKYPLDVRRGLRRKGVRRMTDDKKRDNGTMLKGTWRTYFFDTKETEGENPRKYVVITESRKIGSGRFEKHRIMIYGEDLAQFVKILGGMESSL